MSLRRSWRPPELGSVDDTLLNPQLSERSLLLGLYFPCGGSGIDLSS